MKKSIKKLLGARIKELRVNQHLSQDRLSEKVDIDAKHLSRIEVGGSYPSLDTLENIAKALGVELKDIFEFAHLTKSQELKKNITNLIKEADESKLKLILKVIRAIMR